MSSNARAVRVAVFTFLVLSITVPLFPQQANETVYVAKFFCGFTDGRVPRINDPSPLPAPYRAVEPGNYATVINLNNITSTTFTINPAVVVSVAGMQPVGLSGPGPLQGLQAATIECRDITNALATRGFANDGRFVEGYVTIFTPLFSPLAAYLDVTAGYSYAIQRADNSGTGLGASFHVVHIDGRDMVQPE